MEASKENQPRGVRQPFDFGIKRFKRDMQNAGMPKSYINKAIKMYKSKVYTKVEEIKAEMQKEFEQKQKDATVTKSNGGEEGTDDAPNK